MFRSVSPRRHAALVIVVLGLVASACGSSSPTASTEPTRASGAAVELANPNEVYDPVRAGESLPDGFRQVLARDAIFPVYDPTFVPAAQVDWGEQNLVIGVDIEGEARAYPVGFLTRREMVIDNHRGIPTLVTW